MSYLFPSSAAASTSEMQQHQQQEAVTKQPPSLPEATSPELAPRCILLSHPPAGAGPGASADVVASMLAKVAAGGCPCMPFGTVSKPTDTVPVMHMAFRHEKDDKQEKQSTAPPLPAFPFADAKRSNVSAPPTQVRAVSHQNPDLLEGFALDEPMPMQTAPACTSSSSSSSASRKRKLAAEGEHAHAGACCHGHCSNLNRRSSSEDEQSTAGEGEAWAARRHKKMKRSKSLLDITSSRNGNAFQTQPESGETSPVLTLLQQQSSSAFGADRVASSSTCDSGDGARLRRAKKAARLARLEARIQRLQAQLDQTRAREMQAAARAATMAAHASALARLAATGMQQPIITQEQQYQQMVESFFAVDNAAMQQQHLQHQSSGAESLPPLSPQGVVHGDVDDADMQSSASVSPPMRCHSRPGSCCDSDSDASQGDSIGDRVDAAIEQLTQAESHQGASMKAAYDTCARLMHELRLRHAREKVAYLRTMITHLVAAEKQNEHANGKHSITASAMVESFINQQQREEVDDGDDAALTSAQIGELRALAAEQSITSPSLTREWDDGVHALGHALANKSAADRAKFEQATHIIKPNM